MINDNSSFLTFEWIKAVSKDSNVIIPEHIIPIFEVFEDISKLAIKDFCSNTGFEFKADNSPSGEADKAIEKILKDHLKEKYPNYYFKGEEDNDDTPIVPQSGDSRWLVDPIDGTRNNLYGRDEFSISIAHQAFEKDGWVVKNAFLSVPVKGEVYWASENNGAFIFNYNPLVVNQPIIKPLSIDYSREYKSPLIDISVRPLSPEQELELIGFFREEHFAHRSVGSSANALAYSGIKNDGAIVLSNDYDVAAGLLIANENGSIVSQEKCIVRGEEKVLVVAGRSQEIYDNLQRKCAFILSM